VLLYFKKLVILKLIIQGEAIAEGEKILPVIIAIQTGIGYMLKQHHHRPQLKSSLGFEI